MSDLEPRTEVGRLNLAINTMLDRIDGAIAERDKTVQHMRRFIGDASHELRTPLVSVRGYAELYRMGAISGEEDTARAMERIEKEAIRMGVLVEDLLALARLDEALPQADWLVLACPLTDDTRNLIDARRLALLPPGAHLVNVARGEVVAEPDLVAALRERRPAGAFLDVFAHEPLAAASPLWGLDNVLLSPHTAGHTSGHYAAVAEIFLDNLARWRSGQAMRNLMP